MHVPHQRTGRLQSAQRRLAVQVTSSGLGRARNGEVTKARAQWALEDGLFVADEAVVAAESLRLRMRARSGQQWLRGPVQEVMPPRWALLADLAPPRKRHRRKIEPVRTSACVSRSAPPHCGCGPRWTLRDPGKPCTMHALHDVHTAPGCYSF